MGVSPLEFLPKVSAVGGQKDESIFRERDRDLPEVQLHRILDHICLGAGHPLAPHCCFPDGIFEARPPVLLRALGENSRASLGAHEPQRCRGTEAACTAHWKAYCGTRKNILPVSVSGCEPS